MTTEAESQLANTPSVALAANRHSVLKILDEAGVENVRVFGSVARGEDTPQSDLDLLVDFKPKANMFRIARGWRRVVDLLGFDVDLVAAQALLPRDSHIRAEAIPL